LGNERDWVDRMAWSPTKNQLAFSLGQMVQVWNADLGNIETTLNFDNSSVLDITWHPNGESLAVAGYQGAKIWMVDNWQDDPCLLPVDSASLAIAWSPDGKYLASGNMERTITRNGQSHHPKASSAAQLGNSQLPDREYQPLYQ
jgi:WD40 repeat protein